MRVPWAVPYVDERELTELTDAIQTNWLSMGKRVRKLETLWAEHLGAKHAIAVCNGTIALEVALRVMGIGPGDEVIIPAMTYFATASSVVLRGATPVFADIEERTYNLNPADIAHRITDNTRAIMYIDYGGNPADSAGILAVGRKHGIPVLQDAAQSLGGMVDGQPLGFQAGLSTVSFHAAKLVTTVEGGMIFTDDDAVARQLRILRNQGEDPGHKYLHVMIGYNARMTDLQAAIGLVQFDKFDEIVVRRQELAQNYGRMLQDQPHIELIAPRIGQDRNGWFLYLVMVPNRDRVAEQLRGKGVDTRVSFPMPVYRQPALAKLLPRNYEPACPVAESFTREVLTLPMFHQMTDQQQAYVAEKLIETLEEPCQG
ncbi:DegT/DnrJ/EryC1/StrS family aminotransferase [Chloroflexota bacterium]